MIEQGSSWLGPCAENLDMWAADVYAERLKPFIPMKPSQYINRNVRVTPFNEFEPVRRDFERYPHLSDAYCYPHVEGRQGLQADHARAGRAARRGDRREVLCRQRRVNHTGLTSLDIHTIREIPLGSREIT